MISISIKCSSVERWAVTDFERTLCSFTYWLWEGTRFSAGKGYFGIWRGARESIIVMNKSLNGIMRQIDVKDLEVLLTVAETASFRKASIRLSIGQSAISRRIQKLEDLVGVSLFERRSTGAKLTNAGSEFASVASAIVQDLKSAVASAQSNAVGKNGVLKIGFATSLSCGAPRTLLKRFLSAHKDVELALVECERRHMMIMLGHRALDVVLAMGLPPAENGDGLVLAYGPVFLAVATDHPFAS